MQDAGKANQAIPDEEVLAFAAQQNRAHPQSPRLYPENRTTKSPSVLSPFVIVLADCFNYWFRACLAKRFESHSGQCLLEAMMTATLIQSLDRVVLQNISWQSYQSLIRDFAQEPAMRLTYDHGTLEIRLPLDPHET